MMKFIKSAFATLSMAVALMFGSVVASNAADPITYTPVQGYTNGSHLSPPTDGLIGTTFGTGFVVEHGDIFPTVSVGHAVALDAFVLGGELLAAISETPVLAADVKLGINVANNVAVYGLVGLEYHTNDNLVRKGVGVGVDVGVSDNLILTANYRKAFVDNNVSEGAEQYRVGLKFKF